MRVLVGCEFSGIVRDAFIARGHDAYSCDLIDTERPGTHLVCDIRDLLEPGLWDLLIAHPPCTYLCNSGVLRLYRDGKKKNGRDPVRWRCMREGAEFFRNLINAPVPRICIENPIMHGYAREIIGHGPDQSIQPWEYGEDASKATCLWLKNLPLLVPTKILPGGRKARRANQTPSGQNRLGPSPHRAADRARTYRGIAEAMAEQWNFKEV